MDGLNNRHEIDHNNMQYKQDSKQGLNLVRGNSFILSWDPSHR